MELKELEKEILSLFQEQGAKAELEISQWLKPSTPPQKRAIMRSILSRLCLKQDGTYFLK